MSDKTHADMVEAIKAHITDETEGDYLVDWVLASASVGAEPDAHRFMYFTSEISGMHTIVGLLDATREYLLNRIGSRSG